MKKNPPCLRPPGSQAVIIQKSFAPYGAMSRGEIIFSSPCRVLCRGGEANGASGLRRAESRPRFGPPGSGPEPPPPPSPCRIGGRWGVGSPAPGGTVPGRGRGRPNISSGAEEPGPCSAPCSLLCTLLCSLFLLCSLLQAQLPATLPAPLSALLSASCSPITCRGSFLPSFVLYTLLHTAGSAMHKPCILLWFIHIIFRNFTGK